MVTAGNPPTGMRIKTMTAFFARVRASLGVFSSRDFSVFTAGNVLSLVGVWVQRLAVGWLAWDLTQSGTWLGAVAFADLFPAIFIGPFAGVLADRFDRRRILIACKTAAALQAVLLTVLVYVGMTIEALFVLTLFGGIVVGFQQPARLAIVPNLVPSHLLAQAVALNSVIFNLARFVGPALAGVLITGLGVGWAFGVVTFGHLIAVGSLMMLSFPPLPSRPHRGVLPEIAEGVRHVFQHAALGPIMIMSIISAILGRPVFELLPGFADDVFGRGAGGLAILTSSVAIGAILAGMWLAQRQGVGGLTRVTLISFIASGVMCVVFGLTGWFWAGVVLMAMAGGAMVINGSGTQTLIQASVAGNMRGRVLSIWGLTFRGGPALGALVMGWLAEFWGFGIPVLLGGAACAFVGLWMYRRQATLSRLLETEPSEHSRSAQSS